MTGGVRMDSEATNLGPAAQRYYYVVAFRGLTSLDPGRIQAILGRNAVTNESSQSESVRFFSWLSTEVFGSGDTLDYFRTGETREGQELFRYTCFITTAHLLGGEVLLVGFPFVGLGRMLVQRLVANGILRDASFVRADVSKIIHAVRLGVAGEGEHVRIAKLVSRVEDDAVSRMALGGRDAIHSAIYELLLKQFGEHTFGPKYCVVSFRDQTGASASVHIDNYGNFRFWMQVNCRNIPALGSLIKYCNAVGSLEVTTSVPHTRLSLSEMIEEASDSK